MHEHPEFDDHEQVIFCRDAGAGLRAIRVIHKPRARARCRGLSDVALRE